MKIVALNKSKIYECKKELKKVWKLPENEIFEHISEDKTEYLVFKQYEFALFAFVFFEYHSVRVSFSKKF